MAPFVFMYQHIELFIGALIVLILFLGIVFLWRMLSEKPQTASSNLDVTTLEATLKKLITQAQAVTSSAGVSGVGGVGATGAGASVGAGGLNLDPASTAKLQNLLAEREKAIADLQTSLAEAKKAVKDNGQGEHALALLEIQNKVRDLEARLAEYSIIEDDIADLSMYKEENVRLKRELQELRSGAGPAPAATAPVAAAAAQASPPKGEPSVVDQFAAAVSKQAAPQVSAGTAVEVDEDPLGGALDTSKMLEEMKTLKADDADDDILADALDTDKLMTELGNFGVTTTGGGDLSPEEDLFGEFKDEEKS